MSNKEYLRQELNKKNQEFSKAIKAVYEIIKEHCQKQNLNGIDDARKNYLALCKKKDEVALILEYLIIHNRVSIQCLLSICCANIISLDRSDNNINFDALKSQIIADKNTARALLFFFGVSVIFEFLCLLIGSLVIHIFLHNDFLLVAFLKIALIPFLVFTVICCSAYLDEYNKIEIIKINLQRNGNAPNYTFKLVKNFSEIIEDVNAIEVKILDEKKIEYHYISLELNKINSAEMHISEAEMSFLKRNNCISSKLRKAIMAQVKQNFNNIYWKDVTIEHESVVQENFISKTTTTLRLFKDLHELQENAEVNRILNP